MDKRGKKIMTVAEVIDSGMTILHDYVNWPYVEDKLKEFEKHFQRHEDELQETERRMAEGSSGGDH